MSVVGGLLQLQSFCLFVNGKSVKQRCKQTHLNRWVIARHPIDSVKACPSATCTDRQLHSVPLHRCHRGLPMLAARQVVVGAFAGPRAHRKRCEKWTYAKMSALCDGHRHTSPKASLNSQQAHAQNLPSKQQCASVPASA